MNIYNVVVSSLSKKDRESKAACLPYSQHSSQHMATALPCFSGNGATDSGCTTYLSLYTLMLVSGVVLTGISVHMSLTGLGDGLGDLNHSFTNSIWKYSRE